MPLIRSHYIRMASLLDKREPSKRVAALKKMKLEMRRRFMVLYELWRTKKYGPLKNAQNDSELDLDEV